MDAGFPIRSGMKWSLRKKEYILKNEKCGLVNNKGEGVNSPLPRELIVSGLKLFEIFCSSHV
jgi:hypothetical protein